MLFGLSKNRLYDRLRRILAKTIEDSVQQKSGYQTPSLRAEKETLWFRGARNFTLLLVMPSLVT